MNVLKFYKRHMASNTQVRTLQQSQMQTPNLNGQMTLFRDCMQL